MTEPEKPSSPPTVSDTLAWAGSGGGEPARDMTGATLGDFQIERMLGRGGMGEVYLARQISLNRPVALKMLRPDLLTKPAYLTRFEAEATAVAKLNHPNIVHIYMLGCVDDIRFIAMEYVQGTTLRDYLQKKGALDLPLALSIMKQAGVAIGAAGENGLVHRDIKPENLLLTRKGQVKVTDFGLCRDQDADSTAITQPGVTMGTPLYMSPEQAQGHAIDHRSDLYSLGVTFYHMLSGAPPFRADSALALALKHVKDTPVSLCVRRPEVPPELDRLVLKLMAKDPEERYQSAAEMLRDLSKVKGALATSATAITMPEADIVTAGNGNLAATLVSTGETATRIRPRTLETKVAPRSSEVATDAGAAPAPLLGSGARFGILTGCLLVGLAWGWLSRPPDLLSQTADQRATLPALWMVPDWDRIPRQANPEAQYHHAQLRVARDDQQAAWLAVPGYFPEAREWCSRAYVQLARELLRRRDFDRLRTFAAEMARWNPDRGHEKELAVIIQAAADSLDDNVEEVVEALGPQKFDLDSMGDPALAELTLEVTAQAVRSVHERATGSVPPRLREIQRKLAFKLYNDSIESRDPLGLRRPD